MPVPPALRYTMHYCPHRYYHKPKILHLVLTSLQATQRGADSYYNKTQGHQEFLRTSGWQSGSWSVRLSGPLMAWQMG